MCIRTGDMGKTMVILAPYWNSIWRPPGVANFLGSIFFNGLYVLKNNCAKFNAFLTKCTILVFSRPTISINYSYTYITKINNNTQHAKHGRKGGCSSKSKGRCAWRNFREKVKAVK